MDEFDRRVFAHLLQAVVMTCFDRPLSSPLSEPDSKHLSNAILERTGLVIGWRSLKNYTQFLLAGAPGKLENPSVATLDTLARYVLGAPATTETERKKTEEHFPYWFRYREQADLPADRSPSVSRRKPQPIHWGLIVGLLIAAVIGGVFVFLKPSPTQLRETFQNSDEADLNRRGWFVQRKNTRFWNRRAEKPGYLSLFTLFGDTWPKTGETVGVQNLLLHRVETDCFRAEVHFKDFVPGGNWQQAGLILMEDTLFTGKSIRLSLSYNNYFGGYVKPGEVLIQAIASYGEQDTNLEEFVHQPLFALATANDRRIATTNLKHVAFRVEKQGRTFRILYSASPVDNFSFKEIKTYESDINPQFIGLFALKGFVDTTAVIPVRVRSFRLDGQGCD
ncbi:hypothetical protein [Spirosoma arcticum]